MGTDVNITKGWPDEILQVERVGGESTGRYYVANVVELEPEGRAECRFTGFTPGEAVEKALDAIREKRAPTKEFVKALADEELLLDNELDKLRKRMSEVVSRLGVISTDLAKAAQTSRSPLKATELLEEENMLKQAAAWIDPETERGFRRVAFRLYKDRDGDGDPDIIASWHR